MKNTVLYKNDSVEDLILRGFGDVYIRKLTNVSMRLYRKDYESKLINVDRCKYCALYIDSNFSESEIAIMFSDYSLNKITSADLKSRCGLFAKHKVSLDDVFSFSKYCHEYNLSKQLRQSSIQSMIEQTNMIRYGCKTPMSSDSVKSKVKATMFNTYGVENISQLDVIKQKKRDTLQNNFGVDNPLQSKEILEKQQTTIRNKYGVDNISQHPDIQQKKVAVMNERYGVSYTFEMPDVKQKVKDTIFKKYGEHVDYPLQSIGVRDECKKTCVKRYGVDNPFKLVDVQNAIVSFWQDNYGVSNPSQVSEINEYRKTIMQDRYGVDNPFANDTIKEKIKRTNIEKYGVEYYSQTDMWHDSVYETKKLNGTFSSSSSEDILYDMLVSVFGINDVVRQYQNNLYPFACDFYIKSRDMYIELNAFWTHGGHWYDNSRASDIDLLIQWSNHHTKFYDSAVYNWSISDVLKREYAMNHNLNYVVFWDNDLSDAQLWFAMDCPVAHDWAAEYSWLPKHELCVDFVYPEILSNSRAISSAVKAANGNVFYERELLLWKENPVHSKWGTLQARLFINRFVYLHKLPSMLTNREILRGLSIAGFIRGYSVFVNNGMIDVISKYDVHSIYDPCSGWGERMLTAASLNVNYVGCDINCSLIDGYNDLIRHYNLKNVDMLNADASALNMTNHCHDCVFTCPPYENVEIYTDKGAENLLHDEFLVWWKDVVEHSVSDSTKVFAYQINTRFKDDMNAILDVCGWQLIEQVPVGNTKIGHMTRSKGLKIRKYYDEVQIFIRKD